MTTIELDIKTPTHFENVRRLIILRNPVAKDLFGLDFTGANQHKSLATLITRISDLSIEEVENLEVHQYTKLTERVNKLLEGKR